VSHYTLHLPSCEYFDVAKKNHSKFDKENKIYNNLILYVFKTFLSNTTSWIGFTWNPPFNYVPTICECNE